MRRNEHTTWRLDMRLFGAIIIAAMLKSFTVGAVPEAVEVSFPVAEIGR